MDFVTFRSHFLNMSKQLLKPQTIGLLNDIFKLRIEKGYTEIQIKEFLMTQPYNYTERNAQLYLKKLRNYIKDNVPFDREDMLLRKIEEFERESAILKEMGNYRMWLEVQKELNKMLGLYTPTKMDITTNGNDINTVTAINVTIVEPVKENIL